MMVLQNLFQVEMLKKLWEEQQKRRRGQVILRLRLSRLVMNMNWVWSYKDVKPSTDCLQCTRLTESLSERQVQLKLCLATLCWVCTVQCVNTVQLSVLILFYISALLSGLYIPSYFYLNMFAPVYVYFISIVLEEAFWTTKLSSVSRFSQTDIWCNCSPSLYLLQSEMIRAATNNYFHYQLSADYFYD